MVSSKLLVAFGIFASISSTLAQISPRACTETVAAQQGDTCATISAAQNITVSQFLNSNPTVSDCDLVAGTSYCVADDGVGATTPDTSALTVSSDGTCGSGVTCLGSTFGSCCSEHGYCGDSDVYCGTGCQASFGSCNGTTSTGTTTTTTTPPATAGSPTSTVQVTVTTTQVVSSTVAVGVTATATKTATSVVLTTSVVSRTVTVGATATSTAVVTVTSLVVATSTSLVLTTSVRTSIVLSTTTTTVTQTSVIAGACSTTKPDTPLTTSFTRSSSSSAAAPTTTRVTPAPLFPGAVSDCKSYDKIRSGDTCQTIVSRNGLTFVQLYAWNPSVSCDALLVGYYLCVSD